MCSRCSKKRGENYKVIPVLLPDVDSDALELWFDEEPVAIKLDEGPGGVDKALPKIEAALGLQGLVTEQLKQFGQEMFYA